MLPLLLFITFVLHLSSGQETLDPRCASVTCQVGYKCVIHQIFCYQAPCPPPRAVCAPNDPENPCADHPCPRTQVCQNVKVQCFVPPWTYLEGILALERVTPTVSQFSYPIPECVDRSSTTQPNNCGLHEYFNSCGGCDNTCKNRLVACAAICRTEGACRCSEGFYRNSKGRCVTAAECDAGDN